MFEGILEKVLGRVLGQFIEGFDSKDLNVSVWSGNIVIENVKIKPNVLTEMGFPLDIIVGTLGKLSVKVPWSSIQTSSTVVQIEDIYLLVRTQQQKDWAIDILSTIQNKMEDINSFNETYKQKILDKMSNDDQEQSYVSTIVMNIIENLQIQIRNVKIELINKDFHLGIELKNMEIFNQDMKKDKNLVHKELNMNGLRIYFQENENLIQINCKILLLQNKKTQSLDDPEYKINFKLEQLDLVLTNKQMQGLIDFASYMDQFQSQINMQRIRKLEYKQLLQLGQDYKKIFQQVYEFQQKQKNIKTLQETLEQLKLIKEFEQIIKDVELEVINLWSKEIINQYMKDQQIEEMQNKKSWLGFKKYNLNEEDIKKLQETFDKKTNDQELNINKDKNQVKFEVEMQLEGGSFQVKDPNNSLKLGFEQLESQIIIREAGQNVNLSLQRISMTSVKDLQKTVIIDQSSREKLIVLHYKGRDNTHEIGLKVEKIKYVFKMETVHSLQCIMKLQTDDVLNQKTREYVESTKKGQLEAMNTNMITQSSLLLDILIDAPVIILPINEHSSWLLELGIIQLNSVDSQYNLILSSFQFIHRNNSNMIQVDYRLFEQQQLSIKANINPIGDIHVQMVIPNLVFQLNKQIADQLQQIGELFSLETSSNDHQQSQIIQQNRVELMKKATKAGYLYMRQGMFGTFSKYLAVISGDYLYLFNSPTDSKALIYYYIRGSRMDYQGILNGLFAFTIQNNYIQIQVAWNKQIQGNGWQTVINSQKNNLMMVQQQEKVEKQKIEEKQGKMTISLVLNNVCLELQEEEKALVQLKSSLIHINCNQQPESTEVSLMIGNIQLIDCYNSYMDVQNNGIIDMKQIAHEECDVNSHEKDQSFVSVRVKIENEFTDIDVAMGTIKFNLKSNFIKKMVQFTEVEQNIKQINNKEEQEEQGQEQQATQLKKQESMKFSNDQNIRISLMQSQDFKQLIPIKEQKCIMTVRVELHEVQLRMINENIRICQSEVLLQKGSISLSQYEDSLAMNVQIGNIQLFDLTNYPSTIRQEADYILQERFCIIGIQDQQQSLINLHYVMFNQNNPNIVNNVTSQVDIKVSSIKVDLQMQPLLRMQDNLFDCLGQMTPSAPPSPKSNLCLETKEVKQLLQTVQSENKKVFDEPEWMTISIHIKSPSILIKKNKDDNTNCMQLQLQDIWVSNLIQVRQPRIINSGVSPEEVYVDVFKVIMNDLTIDLFIDSQYESVCNKFDLNIQVILPKNPHLYDSFKEDPDSYIDTHMAVNIRILPVIIGLKRKEYQFIMSLLFFNINYDDLLDPLYNANTPQVQTTTLIQKEKEEVTMHMQLDMENLSFIIQNDDTYGSPLSRITLNKMRMCMKQMEYKMTLDINILSMDGSYYNLRDNNSIIQENPLIGQNNLNKDWKVKDLLLKDNNGIAYIDIDQLDTGLVFMRDHFNRLEQQGHQIVREVTFREYDPQSSILHIQVNMLMDYMEVDLVMHSLHLELQGGALLQLSTFASLDEECQPKMSQQQIDNQEAQMQQYYHKMQKTKQEKYMQVNISLPSIELVMPCVDSQQNVVIQNQVEVKVAMKNMVDYKSILKIQEEKNLQWDETGGFNSVMEASVSMTTTLKIKKGERYRSILMPQIFKLDYHSQYELLPSHIFIPKTLINMNVPDQIIIKMGVKDLALLQNSATYQLEQLDYYSAKIDKKSMVSKDQQKLKDKIEKIQHKRETKVGEILEDNNKMAVDLRLKQLYLMLINDSGESYTPLLSIGVFMLDVKHLQDLLVQASYMSLEMSARYYNTFKSRWENILERQTFMIDHVYSPAAKTNTTLKLEVSNQLNLDISSTMIAVLMAGFMDYNETNKTFRRTFKRASTVFMNTNCNNLIENDSQTTKQEKKEDFVSPYSIFNGTGYDLQIYDMNQSVKSIILKNGNTTNYEIFQDLSKIQEEMREIDLMNNIKIRFKLLGTLKQYSQVENINIDRVRVQRKYIESGNDVLQLICAVELVGEKKRLSIISPLAISNLSMYTINVEMIDKDEETIMECPLKSQSDVSVPLDMSSHYIDLNIEGYMHKVQNRFVIQKILKVGHEQCFPLEINGIFFLLQVIRQHNGLGQTVLEIKPTFHIRNQVGVDIQLLLNQQSIHLTSGESMDIHKFSQSDHINMKVKLENYQWSKNHLFYAQNIEGNSEVIILDDEGKESLIKCKSADSFYGTKEVVFYVDGYLINETQLQLNYVYIANKAHNKRDLAGQVNNSKLVFLENNDRDIEINGQIVIDPSKVGYQNQEIKMGRQIYQLGISQQSNLTQSVLKKEINICYRYVLVNELDIPLQVKQMSCLEENLLQPNIRKGLVWNSPDNQKIQISVSGYQFSCPINVNNLGRIGLQLQKDEQLQASSKKVTQFYTVQVDIQEISSTIFIVFQNTANYQVTNKASDISVLFSQNGGQIVQCVEFEQNRPFGWFDTDAEKKIMVQLRDKDYNKSKAVEFEIAKVHFKDIFEFNNRYFMGKVTVNDNKKTLEILELSQEKFQRIIKKINKKDIDLEKIESSKLVNQGRDIKLLNQIVIQIKKLNISVIMNYKVKAEEVLNIQMEDVMVLQQDNGKSQENQIRVKWWNLDNQSEFNLLYPVVLTPYSVKSVKKDDHYVMNILIKQSLKNSDILIIEDFQFYLDPMVIRLEEQLIGAGQRLVQDFMQSLQINEDRLKGLFVNLEEANYTPLLNQTKQGQQHIGQGVFTDNSDSINNWQKYKKEHLSAQGTLIYIDNIKLSNIEIHLSFKKKVSAGQKSSIADLGIIMESLGGVFMNVDNAKIQLKGFQLQNCYDSTQQIQQKLALHFLNQAKPLVLKLIFSIDILGNPVGLFSNIGEGFKELINKTGSGFVKGPLEGGVGMAVGTAGLIKDTLAGVAGSFDKIAGSVAKGISALTYDQDYLKAREQFTNKKADNIGKGLFQAGEALIGGVGRGIVGIFTKPVKGIQRDGVKGCLIGTYQGLTGLIIKPIAGLFDAAAKTSQGLKNNLHYFDDKPNEKKVREQRVFYGPDQYYKAYSIEDSEINRLLNWFKQGRFSNSTYLASVHYTYENKKYYLVVCQEVLLLFNFQQKKLLWHIDTAMIKSISYQTCKNIKIQTFKQNQKKAIIPQQQNKTDKQMYDNYEIKHCYKEKRQEAIRLLIELQELLAEFK